jgi:hypothetical protein
VGGINDKPRANIELEEPRSRRGTADLVVEGEHPGAGLVIQDGDERGDQGSVDDEAAGSPGLVVDENGGASRLVVGRDASGPAPVESSSPFGDPMGLSYADAQRIAEGKLETSKVLGVIDPDALAHISDQAVRGQVKRFLKKLAAMEMQFGALQKARGNLVAYRAWLNQIIALETAADPAQQLRALLAAEERRAALEEMTTLVRIMLDDKLLEWAEHKMILRRAEQLGLTPADVETIYQRFEPFEREPQAAAERAAATGWVAHPKLATPGEVYAWNLKRLQDAMLQRFDVAVEIANQPFDKTYSLYDYLDRNREEDRKNVALQARQAAEDARCPALAVWYFLWTTGVPALHLGTKDHRPVRTRKRRLETVDELKALVATDWVIDDVAHTLEAGLLENWLFVVTRNEALFQAASRLRQQARDLSDNLRAEYLRHASIRVLWQAGFKGLPLCDAGRRSVVVEDLVQLTSRAEDCWESLTWTLKSGVLAEWLDQFDPHQAARARECAKLM